MMFLHTSPNVAIKIVEGYTREIEAQGVRLHTVILFGSFAGGKRHEWSDIDVALVADGRPFH